MNTNLIVHPWRRRPWLFLVSRAPPEAVRSRGGDADSLPQAQAHARGPWSSPQAQTVAPTHEVIPHLSLTPRQSPVGCVRCRVANARPPAENRRCTPSVLAFPFQHLLPRISIEALEVSTKPGEVQGSPAELSRDDFRKNPKLAIG